MAVLEKAVSPENLARVWGKIKRLTNALGGATTAEEALENLGAMGKWELLWENASLTSEFAAQTLSSALANPPSEYDFFIFVGSGAHIGISVNDYKMIHAYLIEKTSLVWSLNPIGHAIANSSLAVPYRYITITDTGIYFGDGGFKSTNEKNSSGANNVYAIPHKIYGIKN